MRLWWATRFESHCIHYTHLLLWGLRYNYLFLNTLFLSYYEVGQRTRAGYLKNISLGLLYTTTFQEWVPSRYPDSIQQKETFQKPTQTKLCLEEFSWIYQERWMFLSWVNSTETLDIEVKKNRECANYCPTTQKESGKGILPFIIVMEARWCINNLTYFAIVSADRSSEFLTFVSPKKKIFKK